MTVKQGPDNSAVDHPWKRLMLVPGVKLHLEPPFGSERPDSETLLICRATAEADAAWGIPLLDRLPRPRTHDVTWGPMGIE